MKIIIDRFEEDFAVVEVGEKYIDVAREILPPEAREGDIISIEIDAEATNQRRKFIHDEYDDLWE